jgi:hypothetical protein
VLQTIKPIDIRHIHKLATAVDNFRFFTYHKGECYNPSVSF